MKNCWRCHTDLSPRAVGAYRLPTNEITNWPKGVERPVAILLCAPCYEHTIYADAPEGVRPR